MEATLEGIRHKGNTKGSKWAIELLTRDEVEQLFKLISKKSATGLRNRAMLALGYRCGLRVEEVTALFPKDVSLESGTVQVLHGKGNKRRVLGIDERTSGMIQLWIEKRRSLGFNGRQRLFCHFRAKGRPVDDPERRIPSSVVREWMNRLEKKARKVGIDKRIHFHGLRHTFAHELEQERKPVSEIMRQMGHSSLAVTGNYLDHLGTTPMIESLRKREW